MCIFQPFYFLCGCDKLKIATSCANTSTNAQGLLYCRDDPHPHIDDNIERRYASPAHGPGVCANVHCRWQWGLLPVGEYGAESELESVRAFRECSISFDLSEKVCKEREDRWFRLLSTDQQLECLGMRFPRPVEEISLYAQAHFCLDEVHSAGILFSQGCEIGPEQLSWDELNPRYMSAAQLKHATGFLLPAEVTMPGRIQTYGSTPHKPLVGPFKVPAHVRRPVPGVCRICGRNAGDPIQRKKQILFEVEHLLSWRERPVRPHQSEERFEKVMRQIQENGNPGSDEDMEMKCELMSDVRDDETRNLVPGVTYVVDTGRFKF